jgi:DNA-directed RNA polymerase subunit beta
MNNSLTIKWLNDFKGALRREFTISVGDELPAGILKLAKVYIAKNVS